MSIPQNEVLQGTFTADLRVFMDFGKGCTFTLDRMKSIVRPVEEEWLGSLEKEFSCSFQCPELMVTEERSAQEGSAFTYSVELYRPDCTLAEAKSITDRLAAQLHTVATGVLMRSTVSVHASITIPTAYNPNKFGL